MCGLVPRPCGPGRMPTSPPLLRGDAGRTQAENEPGARPTHPSQAVYWGWTGTAYQAPISVVMPSKTPQFLWATLLILCVCVCVFR